MGNFVVFEDRSQCHEAFCVQANGNSVRGLLSPLGQVHAWKLLGRCRSVDGTQHTALGICFQDGAFIFHRIAIDGAPARFKQLGVCQIGDGENPVRAIWMVLPAWNPDQLRTVLMADKVGGVGQCWVDKERQRHHRFIVATIGRVILRRKSIRPWLSSPASTIRP